MKGTFSVFICPFTMTMWLVCFSRWPLEAFFYVLDVFSLEPTTIWLVRFSYKGLKVFFKCLRCFLSGSSAISTTHDIDPLHISFALSDMFIYYVVPVYDPKNGIVLLFALAGTSYSIILPPGLFSRTSFGTVCIASKSMKYSSTSRLVQPWYCRLSITTRQF